MAKLSDNDKRMLLALKPDDITREFLETTFMWRLINGKLTKPKIRFQDEFSLKANEYFNKSEVKKTNVGLFIYNKFIIEENFIDILGYMNEPVNSKQLSVIESKLDKALLNDKITEILYATYIDKTQWLLSINTMVSGSFTKKTLSPLPSVMKKKKELISQNKEAFEKGDPIVAVKIEKELVDFAKNELKGDPGMDLYDSGSRGSFANNYKNMAIMRGPAYNSLKGEYKNIGTSFVEGIEKKDIPDYGTMIVSGAYPKAVGTQVG